LEPAPVRAPSVISGKPRFRGFLLLFRSLFLVAARCAYVKTPPEESFRVFSLVSTWSPGAPSPIGGSVGGGGWHSHGSWSPQAIPMVRRLAGPVGQWPVPVSWGFGPLGFGGEGLSFGENSCMRHADGAC